MLSRIDTQGFAHRLWRNVNSRENCFPDRIFWRWYLCELHSNWSSVPLMEYNLGRESSLIHLFPFFASRGGMRQAFCFHHIFPQEWSIYSVLSFAPIVLYSRRIELWSCHWRCYVPVIDSTEISLAVDWTESYYTVVYYREILSKICL